jgi:hypothetical protein
MWHDRQKKRSKGLLLHGNATTPAAVRILDEVDDLSSTHNFFF